MPKWQLDQAINLSVWRKGEGQAWFCSFKPESAIFAVFGIYNWVALVILGIKGHMMTAFKGLKPKHGETVMKKIITLIVLLAIAGGTYWYVEQERAAKEAAQKVLMDSKAAEDAAAKAETEAKAAEEAATKAAEEAASQVEEAAAKAAEEAAAQVKAAEETATKAAEEAAAQAETETKSAQEAATKAAEEAAKAAEDAAAKAVDDATSAIQGTIDAATSN